MDFSVFSTAPVISAIVILFLIGAFVGYLTGSNNESDKKRIALAQADKEQAEAISRLSSDHEEKVRILNKANKNDIEKLNQAHQQSTHELTEAHQKLVDSLKEGHRQDTEQANLQHGNLIAQLNDANLSNTTELQRDFEERITKLSLHNEQAAETLKRDHAKELQKAKSEAAIRITELEQEQLKLQESIAQLEEKMKDDRKNNTFSMSKSGDRLMSVVRSVQELANELENTSKTVTAGEYSVFNELRDNRKQETFLSLGENEEPDEAEGDSDSLVDQQETEASKESVEDQP